MSWHTLGWVVKGSTILSIVTVALGVSYFLEGSVAVGVAAGVAAALTVLGALFCGVTAVLHLSGVMAIRCPLCGSAGKATHAGGPASYTYLHCPKCGYVHAKGFFRPRYVARKHAGRDET